jgi:hypothetical protein
MKCPRCLGLLVRDYLTDYTEIIPCWSCPCCGNKLDADIVKNRLLMQVSKLFPAAITT